MQSTALSKMMGFRDNGIRLPPSVAFRGTSANASTRMLPMDMSG